MRTMRPMRCFVGPHCFVYFCVMTTQNATFLGLCTQAAMTPKFELGRDFCTMYLPQVHHPMFTRSEVIVLTNTPTNKPTNKQMPLKTSNILRFATTLGKKRKSEKWSASFVQNYISTSEDTSVCIPSYRQCNNIQMRCSSPFPWS